MGAKLFIPHILVVWVFVSSIGVSFPETSASTTMAVSAPLSLRGRAVSKANDGVSSIIRCRLLQVEASMLAAYHHPGATTEVSHTLYACERADGFLYAVEFERTTDASRISRQHWISVPKEWLRTPTDSQHGQPTIVLPAGSLPRKQRALMEQEIPELENSQEDVAPADFTRIGRKTLLAVRIVTETEAPDVGLDEMEAAIFGTIPHPHASTVTFESAQENVTAALDGPLVLQSVAEQYEAATLGNLFYQPLRGPGYQNGVMELNLADHMGQGFVLAGQGIQALAPEILKATAKRLGVTEVTDSVDHVIFCLPNDSLLVGSTVWTAFTYLYEPFSYYQRSRCTKLSVVMHELGHSLGFRHSGLPTNAYSDETGPMGYSVNQYGAPVKGFNSHKNWIAGWFQHYAVHLRRLNDISVPTKTTYVGRVAALADAPHVPLGKEVVLVRLGRTLFLQYNRAKGFHRQTGSPNAVTIVYAEHEEDASTRVASLEVGDVYEYDGYPRLGTPPEEYETQTDDNLGLVVALCRIGVDYSGEIPIDYAELVVQWRDPLGPRAPNLNLALCNIRNDKSAPVLSFGVALDKNPDQNRNGQDPNDLAAQPVNKTKQTILLLLGIAMALFGLASLAASFVLVRRQCLIREQQQEIDHQRRRSSRGSEDYIEKSESSQPTSFETAQTTSFDTWTDAAPPTNTDPETTPSDTAEDQEGCEMEPAPVKQREWWEDIVDSLKKLAMKDDSATV